MSEREQPKTGTVPETAADVVTFLVGQHRRLAALLHAAVVDADHRAGAFATLRTLFAAHEATEQEIVHPRAAHELADGAHIVAARRREEHDLVRSMSAFEFLDAGSTSFVTALSPWRDRCLDHLRLEEDLEFAGLRIQLGVRQLRRMRNAVALTSDQTVLPVNVGPGVQDQLAYFGQAICAIEDES